MLLLAGVDVDAVDVLLVENVFVVVVLFVVFVVGI